jgi:hypothetical protein
MSRCTFALPKIPGSLRRGFISDLSGAGSSGSTMLNNTKLTTRPNADRGATTPINAHVLGLGEGCVATASYTMPIVYGLHQRDARI